MEFKDTDQKMPYSIEAEQAVLGAILLDPEKISAAIQKLKPESFYFKKHAEIFETMTEMFNLTIPVEGILLLEKLREKGHFEDEADKEYLLRLAESSSLINDINYYIDIVSDKASLRKIIDVCSNVTTLCYGGDDVKDVLDIAEHSFYEITNGRQNTTLYKLESVVKGELERWSEQKNDTTGKYDPLKLEISAVDTFIGGFNNSDLVVIAGRPGIGKTSFALNVAYNIANSSNYNPKRSVVFFSLEMSKEQLAHRIISMERRIDSYVLRTGSLSDDQWSDLFKFWHDDLQNVQMFFDDTPSITVVEMKAKLRRIPNLGLIVVDYLQLMNSSKRIENRVLEISDITRSLKILAKEFNVPVILLSQLSRSIEQRKDDNKTPRLSDLRDSGSIEQDADVVIFLSRPDYYDKETEQKNICEVIVEKNRHGQTGKVKIFWDGAHTSFHSLSSSDTNEQY
jgi:replicative DNA helicase